MSSTTTIRHEHASWGDFPDPLTKDYAPGLHRNLHHPIYGLTLMCSPSSGFNPQLRFLVSASFVALF